MRLRFLPALLIPLAFLIHTGCSKKSSASLTVSGKVTYKGEAAKGVQVKLHSPDGAEFSGVTTADGSFTISQITPGDMTVTIAVIPTTGPNSMGGGMGGGGKMPPFGPKGGADDKNAALAKEKMNKEKQGGQLPTAEDSTKIPAKYADKTKSGLKWTVGPDSLTKDFPLND